MFARRQSGKHFPPLTDRARTVLLLAREQASRLNHEYLGTEHILLGIIEDDGGAACQVLRTLVVMGVEEIRATTESLLKRGAAATAPVDIPYTSRAKRVFQLAWDEARGLNHDFIGTEHLLLGLLAEERGIAAQVLQHCGVTLSRAREEVRRLVAGARGTAAGRSVEPPAPRFTVRIDDGSQHSIYEQIIQQVQEAVATRRLTPGDRLPTVRQLADELDIAPGTVARAYGELERLGVVVTEGSRGTRVAERRPAATPTKPDSEALVGLLRPMAVAAFHLGATADQLRSALEQAMSGIFGP